MQHRPSSEANRFSTSQEIPRILCNPKFHYPIRKWPPPALSWAITDGNVYNYFDKTHSYELTSGQSDSKYSYININDSDDNSQNSGPWEEVEISFTHSKTHYCIMAV